jgi:hypothetical protein
MVERVVAQADRRPQHRQVAGGGTLTLSRNWAVTLIGSPSFSHRCATRVRTWLRNITPDATPRKIRKARSGMTPVATIASSAIAQTLPPPPASASRGRTRPRRRAAEARVDLQPRIAADDPLAQLRRQQRQRRQHGEADQHADRRQRGGDQEHRQRPRLHQRQRQIFGVVRPCRNRSWRGAGCGRPSYMNDGISSGMPTIRFQTKRKPAPRPS